jgi:hypothetical protein
MTPLKTPLALLCTFALSVHAAAAPCGYAALQINPLSAARSDIYVGQGKRIEVSFANESANEVTSDVAKVATAQTVETFPESNLKIRNIATNSACEIDGGIWVRHAVYLNLSEHVLVAKQFSGSNESLSFYDTRTCALKSEFDVSNRAWKLERDGLRIGERCTGDQLQSCKATVLHRWRTSCVAHYSKKPAHPSR